MMKPRFINFLLLCAATLSLISLVVVNGTIASAITQVPSSTSFQDVVGTVVALTLTNGVVITMPTETNPTISPTYTDTVAPTYTDTVAPTYTDTVAPTYTDTVAPTYTDTVAPTYTDTVAPTYTNTIVPTYTNTIVPTYTDTIAPTYTDIPATDTQMPTYTENPPTPSSVLCLDSPHPRLSIGMTARVTYDPPQSSNLRVTPGGAKITALEPGTVFKVVDGPVCSNYNGSNYTWWRIQWNGRQGWLVEGEGSIYWIEPYPSNIMS